MIAGKITVRQDWDRTLSVEWSSPVAEMSYAFMGNHVALIRYAELPRIVGISYRRVVNKDWRWWRLYYAWDWLMKLLRVSA